MSGLDALPTAEFGTKLTAEQIQRILLQLGEVSIDLSHIIRKPRYPDGTRETVIAHSYMLSIVAPAIAELLGGYDIGMIAFYSLAHEFAELVTGDTATFSISDEDLQQKTLAEAKSLHKVLDRLPPFWANILIEYEKQHDPESRFVRMVDKILPVIVDILGQGERVMREDYGINTPEELDEAYESLYIRYTEMFPEQNLILLHLARAGLARIFAEQFKKSVELQEA
ncbi:MAG: HD domain-containing protein [Patescibacteria group bacterium]|jgi:5'-deoxynucleotidase YfbR-like HD superfamily hydrolase|nr:HD domain-containing protein [Patescibacteria group bacterium]